MMALPLGDRLRAARSEWSRFIVLARRPETGVLAQALAAVLFLVRFAPGVTWRTPVRSYDSWAYARVDVPGYPDLLDLLGRAPRPWPAPLLYSLVGDDVARVSLQLLISSLAWAFLIAVVGVRLRSNVAVLVLAVAVGLLSFSEQARGWDAMLGAESLSVSGMVLLVVGYVRWVSGPSMGRALVVGSLAGMLVTLRPSLLPACLLVVGLAVWRHRRAAPRTAAAGFVAFAILLAYASLTLPSQQVAFRQMQRDLYGKEVPATQAEETWMSLLYARFLLDADMQDWLDSVDAPPLAPGMIPMDGPDNLLNWNRSFHAAFFTSEAWQQWYRDNGGTSMYLTIPIRTPLAHLRLFVRDLPFILESGWGSPRYVGSGPGPPSLRLDPYFSTVSGAPLDIAILLVLFGAGLLASRRRPSPRTLMEGIAGTVVLVSVVTIVSAWLLCATELVRHSVPGPLTLRLGLVMLVVATLDRALTRDPAPVEARAS